MNKRMAAILTGNTKEIIICSIIPTPYYYIIDFNDKGTTLCKSWNVFKYNLHKTNSKRDAFGDALINVLSSKKSKRNDIHLNNLLNFNIKGWRK